ncbi:hypothetical protein B0H16DRAFT_1744544 [Mycena metata]|uniref:Uncharacterized protein n=1 Tax=Mycena metata TaxID=1033252 RepID=A0AAD7MDP7_9AGAR|nr:hypothetical protein B0H16DRAFT_1744544 [Mycena metata]
MVPPELVKLIIDHAWGCLSTSSHGHAYAMAQWMLVSRDWLKIVLSVVFSHLWITSVAHMEYIAHICRTNAMSFICELAGIHDARRHLSQTCRSLTISVYHSFEGEYASQCKELLAYATADPENRNQQLLSGPEAYRTQRYAIPVRRIATVIRDLIPRTTTLHFMLIDCAATYGAWDMPPTSAFNGTRKFPLSLTELHISFAYTSPPPALLIDAPRSTFFPPLWSGDLPKMCRFAGVRRLVVREANADFVAFMTTACPRLERVESTAEFGAKDVPPGVPEYLTDRMEFMRLPRTTTYPGLAASDTIPIPSPEYMPDTWYGRWALSEDDWYRLSQKKGTVHAVPGQKRGKFIWRLLKQVITCSPLIDSYRCDRTKE